MNYDIESDVNRIQNDMRSGKLNPLEAAIIPIMLLYNLNEILELFKKMIYAVKEGDRKMNDSFAQIHYLSALSHFMGGLLREAEPLIQGSASILNENIGGYGFNKDLLITALKSFEDLSLEIRHYHAVANKLKEIDNGPICDCELFKKSPQIN